MTGFAHFQLISYHLKNKTVIPDVYIPIFFSIAMGVDVLVALLAGKLYDRTGVITLVAVPFLTIPIPLLVFTSSYSFVLMGIVLWGAVMGIQETIMRACVADMVCADLRGTAFGIFNTAVGISWFLGSAIMGIFYDFSTAYIKIFVVLTQLVALIFFVFLRSEIRMEK